MYPLAQILHGQGHRLTGSDNNQTDTVEAVRKLGIQVFMGHSSDNIANADVVVRSAAIKDDNPEIVAARELGLPIIERAELLGYITAQYSKAICVSGTHGKTTVTSMLAAIFLGGGVDITAVIGGKLSCLDGGSGRIGKSDVMICEACEYSDTFLKLSPNISVILNINCDHLEYFGSMDNLRSSFTKFCDLTTDALVINGDDANTLKSVGDSKFAGKVIKFGRAATNDFYPADVVKTSLGTKFDIFKNGAHFAAVELLSRVPGEHNVLNAVVACAVADFCGVAPDTIVKGLASFGGAGRRFEVLYSENEITVADDYAHHPTEITAVLTAVAGMGYKRVWAVHQPFTYSRTRTMLNEFAVALSIADKVTLTEIMGGREPNNGDVCATDLACLIPNCKQYATFGEVVDYVVANAQAGDLIITMGCGDINKVAHMIADRLSSSSA